MADRFLLKKFASNTNDVGQFGSFQQGGGKIGDGVKTTDPDLIQSLPAWQAGWGNAVDYGLLLPRLEEMNGVQRVFAEMLWNQWRDGMTFWQAGAPVKALQSVVMYQTGDELPKIYVNKTGANGANPPPQDTDNWALAFDPTNTQLLSNMEQVVSDSAEKYPSSKAIKDYTSSFDLSRSCFTNSISKFPVNYLMRLSVDSYNQYKPNLNDGNEAIYPMGKNSSLAVGDTFVYGENTGTIKDITTDENGLSFAKITWSTTNYYGVAVTGASQFVLLKDGGQLVNMDNYSSAALIYSTETPAQSDTYNIPAYWYDATNNVMKKSTDKGATWVDCYASFPLASFGTAKDTNGNISVTRCHFCNSVSFMGSKLILLPFGEITAVFYASSFANKRVEKVPTIFKTVEALGVLSNTTNGYYVGAYLTFKGSGSQRTFYVREIHIFSNITNYGFSTGSSTYNLQTGGYYQYGEAGSNPLNFCPLGKFYTKYSTKDNYVSGVDCFGSLLNAPMQPIIQETYHNGTSWYRVWSDGFIEQGGIVTPAAISVDYTGNFIIAFNSVVLNMTLQDRAWYAQGMSNSIINPSGLTKFVYKIGNLGNVNQPMYWYACGY